MDDKAKPQTPPMPVNTTEPIFSGDAKRMSFGSADMYDFKSSPPLSSFFGKGLGISGMGPGMAGADPLSQMSSATRRDSLKGMHALSDFSTD